jgi:hypothetical protein
MNTQGRSNNMYVNRIKKVSTPETRPGDTTVGSSDGLYQETRFMGTDVSTLDVVQKIPAHKSEKQHNPSSTTSSKFPTYPPRNVNVIRTPEKIVSLDEIFNRR